MKRENVKCKKANVRLLPFRGTIQAGKERSKGWKALSSAPKTLSHRGAAHLGDLLELVVGLAALLSCLQSDFIVIHKRFVHTKLAGL